MIFNVIIIAVSGHIYKQLYTFFWKSLNSFIKHLVKCFHFPKTKKSVSALFPQSLCCPGNQTETPMCCPVLFYWPVGEKLTSHAKGWHSCQPDNCRRMFTRLYFLHHSSLNSHSKASPFSPQQLNPSSCSPAMLSKDNKPYFKNRAQTIMESVLCAECNIKVEMQKNKILVSSYRAHDLWNISGNVHHTGQLIIYDKP